ncbi:hypothetical protein GQ53DRAFT_766681 [Thozetella sp. PMI_491]|nr:hypothetical protein GQ53DRAFT_766681 [Thozetella sp. PMI_491]
MATKASDYAISVDGHFYRLSEEEKRTCGTIGGNHDYICVGVMPLSEPPVPNRERRRVSNNTLLASSELVQDCVVGSDTKVFRVVRPLGGAAWNSCIVRGLGDSLVAFPILFEEGFYFEQFRDDNVPTVQKKREVWTAIQVRAVRSAASRNFVKSQNGTPGHDSPAVPPLKYKQEQDHQENLTRSGGSREKTRGAINTESKLVPSPAQPKLSHTPEAGRLGSQDIAPGLVNIEAGAQVQPTQQKLSAIEFEISALKEENATLQAKYTKSEKQLKAVVVHNATLHEQIASCENSNELLKGQNNALKSEVASLEARISQFAQMRSDALELTKQLTEAMGDVEMEHGV